MEHKIEIWRDIEGYEGKYQVSNTGKVRSLNYHRSGEVRNMVGGFNSKGYPTVVLLKDRKSRTVVIHRLVAKAFIPNPLRLPQVNHIDENKSNNNVSNLEWCSAYYNVHHGTRGKRAQESRNKLNCACSERKIEQRANDGRLIAVYDSIREASKITRICPTTISRACGRAIVIEKNGTVHRYGHAGGYVWNYIDNK